MSREEYRKKNQRQKNQRKQQKARMLCTTCLIVLLVLISSGFAFRSKAEEPATSFKYYTEIRVSRDMTLWDIAERYQTPEYQSHEEYMEEIKEINSMYTENINYGQYLTIPYYSEEVK